MFAKDVQIVEVGVILEFEKHSTDRRSSNRNRQGRFLNLLINSHLGRARVLSTISTDGRLEKCEVPFFGYNHLTVADDYEPAYRPEYGVCRRFSNSLVMLAPADYTTKECFGTYPITLHAPRTFHDGAKGAITVCSVKLIDTSGGYSGGGSYEKVTDEHEPSKVLFAA